MNGWNGTWPGEYVIGNPESPVAIVTLSSELIFPREKVAIQGKLMTENIGVEKVVANVISNPNIRFLIVCGLESRGHLPGNSLVSLHRGGIDENNRIVGAKGAVPYIENISREAIERFREQVEVIDLTGETDVSRIMEVVRNCWRRNPGPYGEPFIAVRIVRKVEASKVSMGLNVHRKILVSAYGLVKRVEE